MRRSRVLVPLLLFALLPATAAARRPAPRPPLLVRLTATPALFPAYSPDVHDYVVRCTAGRPVRFTTWSAAGTTAAIGGAPTHTATVRLVPGAGVTIEGRSAAGTTEYHVRCLPADFPSWTTVGGGTSGWIVLTPSLSLGTAKTRYVAIVDGHGVPVWWYRAAHPPIDAKLLPGPTPTVAFSFFPASWPKYQVRRLDGSFVRSVVSPDARADDHELQRLANGDLVYLVTEPTPHVDLTPYGGPADATVLEPRIEEVSPAGKLVWSWSGTDTIGVDESSRWQKQVVAAPVFVPGPDGTPLQTYDLFHPNAVSVGKSVVLISLRHTDAVYAIDRKSGRLLWKLGGTATPESLTVLGDPYGQVPFGGQHDVRFLPDGTISVFDDGTGLGRPPRVVRYRIDAAARTATLVEQVADASVTVSLCCGSARLRANGDWLVAWGGDPVVGEYRPDGTPVLVLRFANGIFSYRAVPVPAAALDAAQLRAAMDAMPRRAAGG